MRFSRSSLSRGLLAIAVAHQQPAAPQAAAAPASPYLTEPVRSAPVWNDTDAATAAEEQAHHESPEYKELHRPAMRAAEMGLYGGELGFEKSPRVYVDPDRPHLKSVYTAAPLNKNLRYARYGFFKRDLHIINVDKLMRHARLIPEPAKVLNDFIMMRAALDDDGASAIVRRARVIMEQLSLTNESELRLEFHRTEELFERMLVTTIPPVDAGPRTHEEMVRCCAVCKRFDEGYNWFRQRAVEEAAARPKEFALTAHHYDATVLLCLRCERYGAALDEFEAALRSGYRLLPSTLAMMLSVAGELRLVAEGKDVIRLYDYFEHKPDAAGLEQRAAWCSLCGQEGAALAILNDAADHGVVMTTRTFSWIMHGLRNAPGHGGLLLRLLHHMGDVAITPDYETYTYAFMYCAHQPAEGGAVALQIYTEVFARSGQNVTPEIVLSLLRAFAAAATPTAAMLDAAVAGLKALEKVTLVTAHLPAIHTAFFELCAALGAAAVASSWLKKLAVQGDDVAPHVFSALLRCNAAAKRPNGSRVGTTEVLQFMALTRVTPTREIVAGLRLCAAAHGGFDADGEALMRSVVCSPGAKGGKKGKAPKKSVAVSLADVVLKTSPAAVKLGEAMPSHAATEAFTLATAPFDVPPPALRRLRTDWSISASDMNLRKLGQATKHAPFYPGRTVVDRVQGFDGVH
jgi:hypothetical protein